MKKQHILTLFALSLLLLNACTHSPKTTTENEVTADSTHSGNIIRTIIPASRNFQQINIFTDMDIEWTEGPCSVTFVGNPFQLADYDIDIDDAGLTVNLVGNAGDGSLAVTSPTLTLLSNYGNGTIRLRGTLHTDHLEIGNMQDGRIEADTLDCQTLKYTSLENAEADFGLVRGDEAMIIADGHGSTRLTLDVRHLNLQAWGTQIVNLDGHADTKDIQSNPTTTVNDRLN
ncbi:MAG: DUF2807 domain-containing protein [Bacteroidaceae bacterium]|nr:DUF2807 domain-containing protein [Bacteroidaceae bacterium]